MHPLLHWHQKGRDLLVGASGVTTPHQLQGMRQMTGITARRKVLWLLFLPACALPRDASAQEVFELENLGRGVHAAVVVPRPAAYAFANSLVVIGEDGVLVVDTQQSPAAARALIGEIRRLTNAPVRWVVNTHWHGDHVYGNEAYREAFPDVRFIAQASLPSDLAEHGAERLRGEIAELPASIEARRRWLAEGRGPGDDSLTDENRDAIRYSLRLREAQLAQLTQLDLIAPDLVFEQRLELRVGAREVHLLHFGPAHTRGDVIVYLPAEGIMAVGDLLEHGLPWFGDGYPAGWAATLDSIAALEPAVLVPSHGAVERTDELLRDERELLDLVVAHARAATGTGTSREQAMASLAVPETMLRRFETRYGVSRTAFDTGVREAVGRAFDELTAGGARTPGRH